MPVAPTIPCQTVQGTIGHLAPGGQGSIDGEWTYYIGMYGPFSHTYTPRTIEPGHFPIYDNNVMATVTALWRTLTTEQLATWTKPAYRKRLPPYTYFIGIQLKRWLVGLPFLLTPTQAVGATVTSYEGEPPPDPDCTGPYHASDTINGRPAYRRDDNAFTIMYIGGWRPWIITSNPDDPPAGSTWVGFDDNPATVYGPDTNCDGYAVVTIP